MNCTRVALPASGSWYAHSFASKDTIMSSSEALSMSGAMLISSKNGSCATSRSTRSRFGSDSYSTEEKAALPSLPSLGSSVLLSLWRSKIEENGDRS
ncbi:hypothetical protein PF007_g30473 [Phytophthora fragariae]|uniref:Uncharacterized protein n=1 Tax=Phytophthora fragariae TaxID=53985 RepID=A0A6A3PSE9_9STRA|nr:hypothetical protein PF007_g30473 [Phytophthora fragariae]